jgi:acetolactate synthase-1/3 small subunit
MDCKETARTEEADELSGQFAVGLLVANQHGVLNRIAGLYNKRGYNIDSLTVGETEDPAISRMTIVSRGDEAVSTQVIRQLNKLYEVKAAALITAESAFFAEHLLIKLRSKAVFDNAELELVNRYGGKVVGVGDGHLVADVTGTPEKVQDFIEEARQFGIIELCRSGALALSSGSDLALALDADKG